VYHVAYGAADGTEELEPADGAPTFAGNATDGLFDVIPGAG
jgi:hypothetical protein